MDDRPVAGYYRVSQARDGMDAPELYETEISRYCTYKDLILARTYSDIDYSAFRGAKTRPSLTELVEARHDYSAVIVPKLSRFGRSMKELIRLFDIFDTDGIPLVFLDMNLDTSTSQGRLLRHILAAFAEYESDVKSDYTRANIRRAAEAGRPHGYIAPFGYTRVGKGDTATLAIDEPRAAIVREVFERYACGEGFSSIGRDLDARGVRGLKGGRWAREQIRLLIDQPHTSECAATEQRRFPPTGLRSSLASCGRRYRRVATPTARRGVRHVPAGCYPDSSTAGSVIASSPAAPASTGSGCISATRGEIFLRAVPEAVSG